MLRRVLLGIALAVAAALALFTHRVVVAVLVAAWSVLATLEFLSLLRRADIGLSRWLICTLNAATVVAAFFGLLPGFLLAPIAVVFLAAVAGRDHRPRVPVYGTFVLIYLGFLPAHLVMLENLTAAQGFGAWLAFFPLLLTWTNDTAALLFGKLAGRHKLAPALSPNKTVEGYVAGLVFSALLAAVYLSRVEPFVHQPVWWLGVIGVGLGTLAQFGDLFESLFKRAAGLKDSSGTLAEHGGFLDRVDSLLFTIPAFYYLVLTLRR
jgi:phosphatidate cytidylyltransferase